MFSLEKSPKATKALYSGLSPKHADQTGTANSFLALTEDELNMTQPGPNQQDLRMVRDELASALDIIKQLQN